jgi:hypothetical protein
LNGDPIQAEQQHQPTSQSELNGDLVGVAGDFHRIPVPDQIHEWKHAD